MHARFVLIAAATLISGSAFAAGPAKPPVPAAQQPQPAQPQVVLASADDLRGASADQPTQSPPKRRIARVTTCRCGDPQASDAQGQSEQ